MKLNIFTNIELDNIDRIKKNLQTKPPQILDGIGLYMVEQTMLNFELQGRPERWKENAPATLEHKTGNLILHQSGLLKLGITHEVENGTVIIGPSGPSLPYSRIQQLGGWAGWNLKVYIPSRKYLVVLAENRVYITNYVRNEVFYG